MYTPSCFYCKLPSDYLFLSSLTARQPPPRPLYAANPFFFSILMPVIKNSDRLSFASVSASNSPVLLPPLLIVDCSVAAAHRPMKCYFLRFSSKLRPRYPWLQQLPHSLYIIYTAAALFLFYVCVFLLLLFPNRLVFPFFLFLRLFWYYSILHIIQRLM